LGTLEVLDIQVSILSIQVHFAHIVQFIHIIIPGVHTGLITAHGFTHDVNVYGEMPSHALAVSIVDGDSAMFMEGGYAMERCYALHVFEPLL